MFPVITIMIFAGASIPAHVAPHGWAYSPDCCASEDCREISDKAVIATPEGWFVKATGEFIAQSKTLKSQDDHFHRCSAQGREDARTYCLYVPEFGS